MWDEKTNLWTVETSTGETLKGEVIEEIKLSKNANESGEKGKETVHVLQIYWWQLIQLVITKSTISIFTMLLVLSGSLKRETVQVEALRL